MAFLARILLFSVSCPGNDGRLTCTGAQCGASFNMHTANRPKIEGVCDICHSPLVNRPDQSPETFRVRLAVYQRQTAPLLASFKAKGKLITLTDPSSDISTT